MKGDGWRLALPAPAARQPFTIRAERNAIHMVCSRGQYVDGFAVRDAPKPDGRIIAAAGQQLAIGTKGDMNDGLFMPRKGSDEIPGPGVPELHRLVEASAGQQLSVRTEIHGPDVQRMPRTGLQQDAVARPPDLHGLVLAAARNGLSLRIECDTPLCPRRCP